jgi:XdhC and CoxI family
MTTADLQSIVKAARALRAEDEERPLLLATAVNVAGSSHRRMGGRMLIAEDRWVTGSVGGGCPQGELIRKAWWFTRDGAPALLSYVARGDEIDCGLGLSSHRLVDLLLEPCDIDDPFDPIAFLESCLVAEKSGVVATVLRSRDPRVLAGARLQIGPDGVVRSQIADDRLSRALATRAGRPRRGAVGGSRGRRCRGAGGGRRPAPRHLPVRYRPGYRGRGAASSRLRRAEKPISARLRGDKALRQEAKCCLQAASPTPTHIDIHQRPKRRRFRR